jgi:plasmid stability protein
MAQLLVRDISDKLVSALKKRAKQNGRSAEAEHRDILERTLGAPEEEFWKEADRIRNELAESGRKFTSSTEVLRRDRDRR